MTQNHQEQATAPTNGATAKYAAAHPIHWNTVHPLKVLWLWFKDHWVVGGILAMYLAYNFDCYWTGAVYGMCCFLIFKLIGSIIRGFKKIFKIHPKDIITEHVDYHNLTVGKTYVVTVTLYDPRTGQPAQTKKGQAIIATKTFTASKTDGTITVPCRLHNKALSGQSLIVHEDIQVADASADRQPSFWQSLGSWGLWGAILKFCYKLITTLFSNFYIALGLLTIIGLIFLTDHYRHRKSFPYFMAFAFTTFVTLTDDILDVFEPDPLVRYLDSNKNHREADEFLTSFFAKDIGKEREAARQRQQRQAAQQQREHEEHDLLHQMAQKQENLTQTINKLKAELHQQQAHDHQNTDKD